MDLLIKAPCNSLAILIALIVLLACTEDEYPVMRCDPELGLNLDNQGVPLLGEEASPIDVTLFIDFQCPMSGNMALYILALRDQLRQDDLDNYLKIHIRHFPSPLHNRAQAAAIAAAAAHRQGDDAFFRLFPHLFKTGVELSDEKILLYAELAQLDLESFETDLEDEKVAQVVDRDFDLAVDIGLAGTPGVVICGIVADGAPDLIVENLEYLVGLES